MTGIEAELREESEEPVVRETRRRRKRRRSSDGSSSRGGGVRFLYFSMAALWGCLAGSGAVVIVLRVREAMPVLDGKALLSLLAALVISVAGAAIVAAAYYSTSRRLG